MATDAIKLVDEVLWLQAHPEFEERPATMREFLGYPYLDIEKGIRQSIKNELTAIFGDEVDGIRIARYPLAMLTGAIGLGKTTVASIVIPYMCHWVLCLKNPQEFFDLLDGSKIAFMQMSTSEKQALEVVFGDIKERLQRSSWFMEKYPYDPSFKNQIRFPQKNVWILPGDSAERTFEGYNILGGILEEMDSHLVTKITDYAELGYETISNRISSRYGDRGFFLLIGQMKSNSGFAAKKYREFMARPDAYVVRMTIWESRGDEYYRCKNIGPHRDAPDNLNGVTCDKIHKFAYDTKRKQIVSDEIAAHIPSEQIMRIPTLYRREFETNPEKALKDLAGIPPAVGDPFISLVHKIEEARDRWVERNNGLLTPVLPDGTFEPWFHCQDALKRVAHVDVAMSGDGDALGLAMGHVREVIEIDGEKKPYIVFDMLLRIKAPAGGEIFFANVRRILYDIKDHLNFRLKYVSLDGYQSQDWRQQMQKRRIESEIISVDKDLLPYHDLREAIYEDRIEFPKYLVHMQPGETELVEVAVKELMELVDNGRKIDHPDTGSKDVADAMAGVCFKLLGDRSYRRNVVSLDFERQKRDQRMAVGQNFTHRAYTGDPGIRAPLVPTWSNR